jgi:hypothetical protein
MRDAIRDLEERERRLERLAQARAVEYAMHLLETTDDADLAGLAQNYLVLWEKWKAAELMRDGIWDRWAELPPGPVLVVDNSAPPPGSPPGNDGGSAA